MEKLPFPKPYMAGFERELLTRKTCQELTRLDELKITPYEEIFRDPREVVSPRSSEEPYPPCESRLTLRSFPETL